MTLRICFLIDRQPSPRHDNATRIPAAFKAAGWKTLCIPHESVTLSPQGVGYQFEGGTAALTGFDLIWLLGLGPRSSFLDRMQLLSALPSKHFVNSPQALLHLHGKYHLSLSELARYQAHSHAACDARHLEAIIRRQPDVDWIIKPAAGSFGEGVHRTNSRDPRLASLLHAATGENGSQYALIQHYLPGIVQGEKRVLVANGHVLGCYLRLPGKAGRTGLSDGGEATITHLSAQERVLVNDVSTYLVKNGCRFAAVDVCYPHLIEVNLANPGGLATLETLEGIDAAKVLPRVLTPLQPDKLNPDNS